MTPDRTVIWDAYDIPAIGSLVVCAPDCDPDVVKVMVSASLRPKTYRQAKGRQGSPGKSGTYGTVYKQRIKNKVVALKLFHSATDVNNECNQGLSGIRANIGVSEGLARLAMDSKTTFNSQPAGSRPGTPKWSQFTLTAPKYHAAILSTTPSIAPVWAMSYENGESADSKQLGLPVPGCCDYLKIIDAALIEVGLEPDLVQYDAKPGNLLVRKNPANGNHTDVVKIDCFADQLLDF